MNKIYITEDDPLRYMFYDRAETDDLFGEDYMEDRGVPVSDGEFKVLCELREVIERSQEKYQRLLGSIKNRAS